MKRRIGLFVSIISICLLFALQIHAATDNFDVYNPSPEELQAARIGSIEESEVVLRYYNGWYMTAFANKADLDTLRSEPATIDQVCTVMPKNYSLWNQVVSQSHANLSVSEVFYSIINDSSIIRNNVGRTAVVQDIICLSADSSHGGIFVYYVTNRGDYVLYKDAASSDTAYFFPLEKMQEVAAAIEKDIKEHSYDDKGNILFGYTANLEAVCDLEPYLLKKTASPLIWIPIVVSVILVGVIAFFLIRHRLQVRKKES